ncbi:hypothetical protein RAH42_08740 [Pyramidobacter sp. YE332]|uniref:hypothetical protein n=1 Tax=unclassified Pyramidobacter TaxID=2632171 RepID=UPI00098F23C8|nr:MULTISPECIES: hypothetical protein [unclassified Pyramidobacter]OON86735.1 hypothetical protein B0D78_11375 [Pyramidobacter sp. C12-8]WOL39236.1 hypothetical protein RAH42_08740 [Pyramidobacter sp. YE332]
MAIVARWEWRTFGKGDFGVGEKTLRALPMDSNKRTDEEYILSRNSDENVKIRFDLIDVKSLQKVNADGLEQWLPVLKTGFPIAADELSALAKILKVELPELERAEYTHDQFIKELVVPHKDLELVLVKKDRDIYKIDGATAEIAAAEFNGVAWRTMCVEHEDPILIMRVVEKLGMKGVENMNYIQAMKKSVGIK